METSAIRRDLKKIGRLANSNSMGNSRFLLVLLPVLQEINKNIIIPLRLKRLFLRVFHVFLLIALFIHSEQTLGRNATLFYSPQVNPTISLQDSNHPQELKPDTVKTVPQLSKDILGSKVDYTSVDSTKYDIKSEKVFLWGEAKVTFEDISLEANYIEIDLKSNLVYAKGLPDSTGKLVGTPKFKDGASEYEAEQITYNFDTEKGKISNARTQEGDGYVIGEQVKKESDEIIYIKHGKYTTCNLEEPHFHIQANKLKIIQNDKIVTGPANLRIENIPTPLAIPFGFFPNKRERSSGILIPGYGNSPGLGYFLQNGGFYVGESDNWEAILRGDVYTNGSWATNSTLNYKKRYKRQGNLNFKYSDIRRGDEEAADYTRNTTFFVKWKHQQDTKANPNSNFSADVNAGSSNSFRNDINTSDQDYLQPQFQSSINYTRKLGSKFNLALSANQDQNRSDSTLTLVLPQTTFTMSRIFPFKSLSKKPGKTRFYEDIGLSYTFNFKNRIQTKEDQLFTEESLDEFQNGIQHSIPLSTSFKLLKHFTLNPSINYSETWYFESIRKSYNTTENDFDTTEVSGFQRYNQMSMSTGLTTKLYGMYDLKFSRMKKIRHVMTPSVSFTYRPDWSGPYYQTIQADSTGNTTRYSYFDGGIYGAPGRTQSGLISFSLINNIEGKYKSKADTATELKKIKLLENLSFNSSYDIFADSLAWSTIRMSGRTNIGQKISLQFGSTFDPYTTNSSGSRIERSYYDDEGKLLRLVQANAAVTLRFQSKKRTDGKDSKSPKESEFGTEEELDFINQNPNAYIDFNIPWSLNINYNVTYTPNYNESSTSSTEIVNTLGFSGDISVTENWKVEFRSGYDFEQQDISYTSINVYRDLHCWQINFSMIPFGTRTSYTFNIAVKAPVLQDLKLQRRRSYVDY